MTFTVIAGYAIDLLIPSLSLILCEKLRKREGFKQKNYWLQQLALGLIMGLAASLETGISLAASSTYIDFRDAIVLAAGLLFGWPAGIFAGFLSSGMHYFLFGLTGHTSLQLAGSMATICAGFFAAILRKLLFENQIPTTGQAFAIGFVHRLFHTCFYFVFHISQWESFLDNYQIKYLAMTIGIALSLFFAVLVYWKMERMSRTFTADRSQISLATYMQWALITIFLIAAIIVANRVWNISQSIADGETKILLSNALNVVKEDIETVYDEFELSEIQVTGENTQEIRDKQIEILTRDNKIGSTGGIVILEDEMVLLNSTPNEELNEYEAFREDLESLQALTDDQTFLLIVGEEEYFAMHSTVKNYDVLSLISYSEAYKSMHTSLVLFAAVLTICFSVIYFVLSIAQQRMVVRKIQIIETGLRNISEGNLEEKMDVRTSKEFASLSDSINTTVDTLKGYIAEASERMAKDLQLAKEIQMSALPTAFEEYGECANVDLYALMDTAKEVGGDFYDFYGKEGDNLYFLIADVSGKGIPAAMFMMRSKTAIHGAVRRSGSIEQALAAANDYLCKENEANMFVTAWQGYLEKTTGKVTYVSAGHNPPILKRADGKTAFLPASGNFMLGGIENIEFQSEELVLNSGDLLVLYTDGVTEAVNAKDEFYGDERLLELIRSSKNTDAKAICNEIKDSLDQFATGVEQFDDITILAILRK